MGLTLTQGRGQTVPAAALPPALPPDIAAILAAQPAWSSSVGLFTDIGYKDNVLLSHANAERSGLARGGVDALLLHVPRGRLDDYSFALLAEGTRYFSSRTVDHETIAIATAEWRYHPGAAFKFTLDAIGLYSDQILDLSNTDVQRVVAEFKVGSAILNPTFRWTIRPTWWIEAQGTGKRATYRDGANYNYHLGEGALRLGWRPGARFEASAAATERQRRFDQHEQYSISGRELSGTILKITEREAALQLDVKWDAAARWITTTRAGTLRYTDNGSGYFNYRQRKITQSLDWTSGDWQVQAEGAAKRLDYTGRTVGLGLRPPPRVMDEFSAALKIERKLNAQWSVYAKYSWERSRSNDLIASYRMNEGLLGAQWNWEK
ncbi:MAG: hypothetical protein EXS32_07865 [Opitutus sp.]|nr:hypothetical protein [Opitutus sp.]